MRTLYALVLIVLALGCNSPREIVKNIEGSVIVYCSELEECGNPYVFLNSCNQNISDTCNGSGIIVSIFFKNCNGSYRFELIENDKVVLKGQYQSTDSIKQEVLYFYNEKNYETDSLNGFYLFPARNGVWLNYIDSIVETYSNGYLTATTKM